MMYSTHCCTIHLFVPVPKSTFSFLVFVYRYSSSSRVNFLNPPASFALVPRINLSLSVTLVVFNILLICTREHAASDWVYFAHQSAPAFPELWDGARNEIRVWLQWHLKTLPCRKIIKTTTVFIKWVKARQGENQYTLANVCTVKVCMMWLNRGCEMTFKIMHLETYQMNKKGKHITSSDGAL